MKFYIYQEETRVFKILETLQGSYTVQRARHLIGDKEKWGCNFSVRGEAALPILFWFLDTQSGLSPAPRPG